MEFITGFLLGLVPLVLYIWWHTSDVNMWYEPREIEYNEDEWEITDSR